MLTKELRMGLALVGLVSILGFGAWSFNKGYHSGKANVQDRWDAAELIYQQDLKNAQDSLALAQKVHDRASQQVSQDLLELHLRHEHAIAALRSDYDYRLRDSAARAESYRRAASGGEAQCLDLAGYAARLDRALEEGILLAGELEATIEQRDAAVKLLAKQITADRELLDER